MSDPATDTAAAAVREVTCEEVVASLHAYDLQRVIGAEAEAERKRIAERIKGHLEQCRDEHVDGERGLVAEVQERQGTPSLDLITMAERDEAMVVALAGLGCLKVDWPAFKAMFGKSSAVDDARAKYLMPGGQSTAISVRKRRI